jgi:hypothetical protein
LWLVFCSIGLNTYSNGRITLIFYKCICFDFLPYYSLYLFFKIFLVVLSVLDFFFYPVEIQSHLTFPGIYFQDFDKKNKNLLGKNTYL